jgi:hypothetical protein
MAYPTELPAWLTPATSLQNIAIGQRMGRNLLEAQQLVAEEPARIAIGMARAASAQMDVENQAIEQGLAANGRAGLNALLTKAAEISSTPGGWASPEADVAKYTLLRDNPGLATHPLFAEFDKRQTIARKAQDDLEKAKAIQASITGRTEITTGSLEERNAAKLAADAAARDSKIASDAAAAETKATARLTLWNKAQQEALDAGLSAEDAVAHANGIAGVKPATSGVTPAEQRNDVKIKNLIDGGLAKTPEEAQAIIGRQTLVGSGLAPNPAQVKDLSATASILNQFDHTQELLDAFETKYGAGTYAKHYTGPVSTRLDAIAKSTGIGGLSERDREAYAIQQMFQVPLTLLYKKLSGSAVTSPEEKRLLTAYGSAGQYNFNDMLPLARKSVLAQFQQESAPFKDAGLDPSLREIRNRARQMGIDASPATESPTAGRSFTTPSGIKVTF